uniref:Pancreatic trypsin inhibitor n=1 Tax=Rhipicephalus appendiculatus TaxID=34631 RepID=A0A131Z6Q3_RHIAP
MIFIGLVFFWLVLSPEGTAEEPTCKNQTKNKRVLWTCDTDDNNITCYESSFYYDYVEDKCKQLVYKGCGGNGNNFPSHEDCTATCKQNMTTYDHTYLERLNQSNLLRFNCTTRYEPSTNGVEITRFYYDSKQKKCKMVKVSRGDEYFPTLRNCLFMCNATKIVPERCQRKIKNGSSPIGGWKCYHDARLKLFCYKPKNAQK